jgi:quercetin dioxygenase-like cupin family protein
MLNRNRNLQRFIDATEAGIRARAMEVPAAMPMADRIFAALKYTGGVNAQNTPARLAACGHLESALSQARGGPDPIPELTDALTAIEPEFAWSRRPGSAQVAGDFDNSHANAVILGDGGLEVRPDVRIGVSLVAPGTHYPRHRHPPEELYVVLSPGEWMQDDNPFAFKRSGDLVHNGPNSWHAMHATDVPLLAIWCLWVRA